MPSDTKLKKGAKLGENKKTKALQQKIADKKAAGGTTTGLENKLLKKQTKIGNRREEARKEEKKGTRTGMGAGTGLMAFMDAAGAAKTGDKVKHLAGTRFGNKDDIKKTGIGATVKGGPGPGHALGGSDLTAAVDKNRKDGGTKPVKPVKPTTTTTTPPTTPPPTTPPPTTTKPPPVTTTKPPPVTTTVPPPQPPPVRTTPPPVVSKPKGPDNWIDPVRR